MLGDSLCSWRRRQAERFRSLEANLEPAPRCCWNRSPCAIKSPRWSAMELVAPAFAFGIASFGLCSRAGGTNGATAWIIVQPEPVLRWCRDGWSALWKYRSRGRWRGGRPRVSNEVRRLIAQMARQNCLWGAPRIHGETSDARFQRLPSHRVTLPACTMQTAWTIVADFS